MMATVRCAAGRVQGLVTSFGFLTGSSVHAASEQAAAGCQDRAAESGQQNQGSN